MPRFFSPLLTLRDPVALGTSRHHLPYGTLGKGVFWELKRSSSPGGWQAYKPSVAAETTEGSVIAVGRALATGGVVTIG